MAAAPVRMSLFKPVYLDQRVSLSPTEYREAAANMDDFLVKKIRTGLEGQCSVHGWVRPGSTQILARSMGQAEHGRFTGDFLFYCKVKVMCFEPYANQIVEARILKMNKLGAYALIVDQGRLREAARILVPRDLPRIQVPQDPQTGYVEFDGLQAGQGIRIRLLKSTFQKGDAFIQSVGTYEGLAPAADAKAEGAAEDAIVAAAALQPAVAPTEGVAAAAAVATAGGTAGTAGAAVATAVPEDA
jgi:DNA-directed RNA polymerase subunit E'/Rpb7